MFFVHNRFFILKELNTLKQGKKWSLYKRILNEDNLHRVTEMIKDGAVVISFSKSSVEPLLENSEIKFENFYKL